MRKGQLKILNVIVKDKDGLTYTEIKKQTNLSGPVISDYLKELQNLAIITKEDKKYSVRKHFTIEEKDTKSNTLFRALSHYIRAKGLEIQRIKDKNERLQQTEELLNYAIYTYFPYIIQDIFFYSLNDMNNQKIKESDRIEVATKNINQKVEDWITPSIQQLSIILSLNHDVLVFDTEKLFKSFLKPIFYYAVEKEGIEKVLNEIKKELSV